MKKIVFVLFFILIALTNTFSQISLSAGGGAHFDYEIAISSMWNNEPKIGAFAFFDATYGEVDINFGYNLDRKLVFLNIGLFGKYPFNIGVITIAPMIGINIHFPFKDNFQTSFIYNLFSIGAGINYSLSEKLFIKSNILFNMSFHGNEMSKIYGRIASLGPQINIGIGYRFK